MLPNVKSKKVKYIQALGFLDLLPLLSIFYMDLTCKTWI